MSPANFWTRYQKDLIVKNMSDQGPWGGYRAIDWLAEKEHTFNSKVVLAFALKHGWQFMDSINFPTDSLQKWKYYDRHIFPLSSTGFSPPRHNINWEYDHFPRWINSNLTVYEFNTGWEVFEPGTNNSTEKNGFVVINKDGTEMSVYHLWGE
jgi:hypothetical protein